MATVAELLVKIGGDSQGLRKEIAASQRQLKRAFGPGALELSGDAAGLMAMLGAAMVAAGAAAVKMSADFAASKVAFTQLLGSADKATEMLDNLSTFAADTPFELPGLIKSTQKLLAFQFAGEDVIPIMAAVGNAVSLVGGGQEAIDGVVRALGQIQAKGKLSAEEMNQLAERGINGWKYIADAMGISVAEVMALCEKGAIDSTTAINAVVLGMQANFKGGMDAMSKTVPGLLSTIKDNVGMVMRDIGDKITTGLDLQGVLQNVADALGTFGNAVKSAGIKEAILGLVPPEVTVGIFALGGALTAVAIPALVGFAGALLAALAPMAAYIAIGAVVGLLSYEIWRNWEPLADLFGALWDSILGSVTAFGKLFISVWDSMPGVVFALGGAITAVALPSLMSFAGTLISTVVPALITATTSLVSFGAGLVLDVLSGLLLAIPAMYNFAAATWAAIAPMTPFLAAGAAVGLLAYEIWENWEPLSNLFSSLWEGVTSAFSSAWDLITGIISDNLGWALNYISDTWNTVKETTSGIWNSITSAIGSAWDSIKNIVSSGMNFIVNAIQPLLNLIGGAIPDKMKNFLSTTADGINKVKKAANGFSLGFAVKDISSLVPAATPKPNQTFTGLHSTQQPGAAKGKEDKKAATEAAQVVKAEADYEIDVEKNKAKLLLALIKDQEAELERQRKNGLSGIRDYWASRQKEDSAGLATIQAYWDKRTALETSGVQAELDALNSEKSALETQISQTTDTSDSISLKKKMLDLTTQVTLKERELGEVIKKNSALAATESTGFIEKYASLMKSTQDSMKDLNTTNVGTGLFGSSKDLADMDKEKTSRLKSVQDIVDSWEKGSAEIKDTYGVAITDTVEMEKWKASQIEMINKQSIDKQNLYYSMAKDVQSQIDAAYQQNSMSMLQKALTEQNAIRLNDYNAQKTMMDTYQAAFLAAHSTTAQLMANMYAGAFSGLQSSISGILQGTESINEAFTELGQTMLKVVADYIAKWIAGKVMMAIFGKTTMATETAASIAAGATTAAAWAPAAAMVSLASFGANSAPAMAGIAATTALSSGLALAGFATGGAINGPGTGTSDSILSWLSNGEYVLTAATTKALGTDTLNTINATGKLPGYATGGLVTGRSLSSVGSGYSTANTAVSDNNESNNTQNTPNQPAQENHIHLYALDGKSTEQWLYGGGGKAIHKFLNNKAKSFALGV